MLTLGHFDQFGGWLKIAVLLFLHEKFLLHLKYVMFGVRIFWSFYHF